jgi:hypothetical protein
LVPSTATLTHFSPSLLVSPAGHAAHDSVPALVLYVPGGHSAQPGRTVMGTGCLVQASKHAQQDAQAPSSGQRDGNCR